MIGMPQNDLAKFLVKTLAPVLDKFSNYSVKDSFKFKNKTNFSFQSQKKAI